VSTADRLADPALRYETDHDRLIQSAPRAYLAVPVSVRDEVLGVLVCYYFAAHQFSAKEAQLLSSLAAHAAIAMDNARHHQAVMLQQNRLSQIFDATSDGMLLVSPAGRVETANRRAGDLLAINYGTLYPSLLKLEQEGYVASEWGLSENNRRAKFYQLTAAGRAQLRSETPTWLRHAEAIAQALRATAPELA